MSRLNRSSVVVAVAATLALSAFSAPAADAFVTLGQTSSSSGFECSTSEAYTQIQPTSEGSDSYTVPSGGGTIVSWSHDANASTTTKLRLKVYRPTADPARFTVIGESDLETILPNELNTFATDIPVQAGDVLGYTRAANSDMRCLFQTTGQKEDTVADAPTADDPLGAITNFNPPAKELRLNISAVLELPPVIVAPLPIVPPLPVVPPVPTTVAGCNVPNLRGLKLPAAKRMLKAADCKLGKVTKKKGAMASSGKVGKQSPKAGEILAPGTKVNVKLAPPQ